MEIIGKITVFTLSILGLTFLIEAIMVAVRSSNDTTKTINTKVYVINTKSTDTIRINKETFRDTLYVYPDFN